MSNSSTMRRANDAGREVQGQVRPLLRYLRFLGCSETQAEDLTQETILAVLQQLPSLREPGALPAYCRSIARNLFLKSLKRTGSEPLSMDLERAEEAWRKVADDARWEAYLEALRGCVSALPPRDRGILERRYVQNGDRREMAAASGMSPEGFKTLLRRIKERLKLCVRSKLNDE